MDDTHYLKDELYELLSKNTAIFDFLQNGSLDGLWYWDIENPENEWMNARFWELLGYDPKEKKHLSKEWQDLINQDDLKVAMENFQKHCEDPNHRYDQIVRYRHKNGKTIWVRCRGIAIRDKKGKPLRMLGAHNDLTEIMELGERLKQLASTDSLTGLVNKRSFEEHFEWTLKNLKRNSEPLSLAIIDIDHFKKINDQYGHQIGDSALVAVSSSIKKASREYDYAARWGGDEFIILLHGTDLGNALMIMNRINDQISKITEFENKITASIGVSTLTISKSDTPRVVMDQLFKAADQALYVAKSSGRNQVVHSSNISTEE